MKYVSALMLLAVLIARANAGSDDGRESKFVGIGMADKSGTAIGLRFIPPHEDDWHIDNTGLSATLKNKASSDSSSSEIEAYLIKLDTPILPIANYIETIKRNTLEGYARSQYWKISALEVSEDPNDMRCARVHLLLEAVGKPQAQVQPRKWSEQYVLSCGLLKHKGLGFEVRYYHRYLDSNKDAQFENKARSMLASAVLEDD